jgi:hypothetical protein
MKMSRAGKEKYIGNGGLSGGVRMTVETQDGIVGSRTEYFGDPSIRQKVAMPLEKEPQPSTVVRQIPEIEPAKVITQPKPWWRRLFDLFLAEKTK